MSKFQKDELVNEEIMHDLTGMQANVQEKPVLFQVPPHVHASHAAPATTTQLPSTTQSTIAAEAQAHA
ncbi:hypothetical protein AHF37_04321 [Paragonimus kellicotti]|nr:hypothetical protein AHF37_04321 [Paragonimus kellicotti]